MHRGKKIRVTLGCSSETVPSEDFGMISKMLKGTNCQQGIPSQNSQGTPSENIIHK